MIDLRTKGLPNVINVNGESFSIVTDFREWLKFEDLYGKYVRKESVLREEIDCFFTDKIPKYSYRDVFMQELKKFYENPNITPNNIGGASDIKLLDYIEDGEYIVASFLAEYGIDLTEVEYLHWQKFQALFRSLSEDSKIKQIMNNRAWEKSNKKEEDWRRYLRDVWTLPDKEQMEENEKLLEEFNKL